MERKDRIPQPKPLTILQAARCFGTRENILRAMVDAGIISPEKDPGAVHSGRNRIRPSQFWKVEKALKKKEEHPEWEWPDIAREIPRMRPREY